jgi:hypothetical protein
MDRLRCVLFGVSANPNSGRDCKPELGLRLNTEAAGYRPSVGLGRPAVLMV